MQSTNTAKTIEITVKPDGQTVVETKGFAGAACHGASRFIEQALGQRQSEQLTAGFYQQASQQTENRQRT